MAETAAPHLHMQDPEAHVRAVEEDLEYYRTKRFESRLLYLHRRALIDRGVISQEELDRQRAALTAPTAWHGGRIVARAWMDATFKQSLLTKGREAVRELDIPPGRLGKLGIAENTAAVHNVVVCTLCSCYPHDLLGDTPWWYKHDSYKQQIVRDPRGTLQTMFGLEIPEHVQVQVHD